MVRCGQLWLGSRVATVARHCFFQEPSDAASKSSAAAPILRRMSGGSAAAAMVSLVLRIWSADPAGDAAGSRRREDCRGAAERDNPVLDGRLVPALSFPAPDA